MRKSDVNRTKRNVPPQPSIVADDVADFFLATGQEVFFRGLRIRLCHNVFQPNFLTVNGQEVYWPMVQSTDEQCRRKGVQPRDETMQAFCTFRGFGRFLLTRKKGGMHFAIDWIARVPEEEVVSTVQEEECIPAA